MAIDIESLGFTKEELQQRVVDQIVDRMLTGTGYNPESDEEFEAPTSFHKKISDHVIETINKKIAGIAEAHVIPAISAKVDNLVITETSRYGEKVADPITFTEYMVKRAEAYLSEHVDNSGKSKAEAGSHSSWFSAQSTRLTFMVHQHLAFEMKKVVDAVMAGGIKTIANAVHETVRIQLNEVAAKLKVEVKS